MLRRHAACLLVLLFVMVRDEAASRVAAPHKNITLPVTTPSPQARKCFEKAWQNLEYIRRDDALANFRQAAKADPNFPHALILISHLSPDPEEQRTTRLRATQLAPHVTQGERLLVRWLAGVQEDNYVPAIAAMNDLLALYPKDQRLAFLAGRWLVKQQRYPQAVAVLERAVSLEPDYPAALNELGYAYAFGGDFEKGFAAMERYVALQPDQPNPHDSYAEILRLAGKFDAALDQYRTSIRIDPNFGSELGVADTYAVMGKEPEAREEYERAIVFATNESDKVEYELQSAMTWVREDNRKQAERALRDVAKHAHTAGLGWLEAEAQWVLALCEPDYKLAKRHLQAAQDALSEGHAMSRSDADEEQARIWQVHAMRAAEAQDWGSASIAVKELESVAQSSRSQTVQLCYHAAAGAVLVAQEQYSEAVPHLEEDASGPLSMRLLWRAYSGVGAADRAQAVAARLSSLNVPTVEQALVVPQFRANLVSQARQP